MMPLLVSLVSSVLALFTFFPLHPSMAEETQVAAATEVVVAVPETEKQQSQPAPPADEDKKATTDDVVEIEKPTTITTETKHESPINQSVGDLEDPEKKALDELTQLIQEALNKHEFVTPPPPKEEEKPGAETSPETETSPPPVVTPAQQPKSETETTLDEIPTPTQVVETATAVVVVEEDGTKTVEAIQETIVSVQKQPQPSEPTPLVEEEEPAVPLEPEEVSIFGIPLLADHRSDVILMKFLRARDFKVKEAFIMIRNTVRWRMEFGIDDLLEEHLGTDLDKVVFMNGFDKQGHPVCYNAYGEFQNKDLYHKTFLDEEKGNKFLRWRIQFLEKSIRNLDFSPAAISTIVQVSDLNNSPGPFKRDLRIATNQALSLLQDNYPEFVAKQVFINVPWWYLAFNRMISPFLTQRTKSKFVFAGPSKSAEILFKYIAPEQVPIQYGGLNKEGDQEFSTADAVTEVTIRPTTTQTVEFPVSETCALVWEVRVVGWDVSYGAEFVPTAEDGYTVIVQKSRKISPSDEPVICNSFKIGEPGKVVLTFDNTTSKKKKLLFRSKTKPSSE